MMRHETETPSITGSAYAHSHTTLASLAGFANQTTGHTTSNTFGLGAFGTPILQKSFQPGDVAVAPTVLISQPHQPQPKEPPMSSRRLVQVFIADTDANVPLEKSMLYSGEQKFTDATDQELFFEIDIKTILEKHNADRTKIINKKVKDRTEFLEPVKIRDLKMVVTTVASF